MSFASAVAMRSTISTSIALLVLSACSGQQTPATQASNDKAANSDKSPSSAGRDEQAQTAGGGQDASQLGDFRYRKMLVDVAEARLCDRVKGSFLAMSSKAGTSFQGGTEPTVGTLWIESCSARQVSEHELELRIGGRGWKRLDRMSEAAGADFSVEQYLRFGMEVEFVGSVELNYSPDSHVFTAWMKPNGSVSASFDPLQDVQVNEVGMWSEVVGGAATLFGSDPDDKADKKVDKKGKQKVRQRLAQGYTFAYDLCSNRSYSKAGTSDFEAIPKPPLAYPAKGSSLINSRGILYPGGLILAGPMTTDEPIELVIESAEESGPMIAKVVCKEDANKLAEAYVEQKELPPVPQLAVEQVEGLDKSTLFIQKGECEAVLALQMLDDDSNRRAEIKYAAYHQGPPKPPMAECGGASAGRSTASLPPQSP